MFATSIPLRLRQRYNVTGHFLEPESRPGFAVVFASLGLMAGGLIVHPMGFALGELTPLLILPFYLWLAGFGLQILGRDNAALAAKTVALFLLLSMTVMLASAALAPLSRPCVDTMLNHIDGRLFPGFDWPATMKAIGNDPWLGIPLSLAYSSLNWQPLLILIHFCLIGRSAHSWHILNATALALLVCLFVFPFFPAVGGYVHFGLAPTDVPFVRVAAAWKGPDMMMALQNGQLDVISLRTMGGLITMPSFHAASAVILGWGFAQAAWLRWPLIPLNIVMWFSCIPVGGHYAIDVIIGSLLAAAAIRLTRSLSRTPPQSAAGVSRP